ncbi:hypothetical protein BgAZ_107820 [Babesia gibsoni]|uniref:Clathrin light chain n=1 Tax=Babesia gibsoni TaxID=33632 RepID=A0AAD8PGC9_BABGI|nr:hypothetical protein BgAZ_107820 [Babesia gibsoni]
MTSSDAALDSKSNLCNGGFSRQASARYEGVAVDHMNGNAKCPEDPQKNEIMKKWREDVQRQIEAKKEMEAKALQEVTTKAKQELDSWMKSRKEKIDAKSAKLEKEAKKESKGRGDKEFDWRKVADMLTKSGFSVDDQSSGPSQKMVELIFMKAKEQESKVKS